MIGPSIELTRYPYITLDTYPDSLVEDLGALLDRHQVLFLQVTGTVDIAGPVSIDRVCGIYNVDEFTRLQVIHLL